MHFIFLKVRLCSRYNIRKSADFSKLCLTMDIKYTLYIDQIHYIMITAAFSFSDPHVPWKKGGFTCPPCFNINTTTKHPKCFIKTAAISYFKFKAILQSA